MAIRSMLWVLTILVGLTRANEGKVCYGPQGDSGTWGLPCNPDDAVSVCCNEDDYCLSNGLCLTTNTDNVFKYYGCTDSDWPYPCRIFCGGMYLLLHFKRPSSFVSKLKCHYSNSC